MALRLCVLVALFWACVPAWPAEVATRDGLALRLEDAGGSVAGVAVAGRPLRLLDGATGGLSYRELRRNAPREPQVLARADFESETGPWVAAAGISRGAGQPVAAALRSDGGAEGSRRCMRLGEKQQYGHGVAFTQRVPVESGCAYEIAWHGRVPASSATYIVYVRVYDNKGRDITGATAAPAGWTYSPYSKTHCQYPIALGSAGAWERVARTYCTSEDAAALDVSLCLWRGDYADADLFTLARVGCAAWSKSAPLRGKAEAGRSAGVVRHAGKSPDGSLAFDATYTPAPDHIRCDVGLRDTGVPRQTRALPVCYTLPVDAAGWTWGDDALSSRRVEPGERLAGNTAVSGHSISPYPFSSLSGAGAALSGDGAGLSLATPMDAARLLSFSYGPDGYKVTVDLALSPETAKLGPGTGSFSFLLYGFDPEWGFRAAAEKYHRLMPAAFKGLPVPHGAWMWPVPPGEIHEPQDFGFAFLEYHSLPDAEIARCKALGIQAIHYIEPLGVRQWHPKARTREEVPSCEEALKELEAWAAETSDTRWAGVPRS